MARPIMPTPILKGKDAEKLLKEMERTPLMSEKKKAEMEYCLFLYKRFWSKLKTGV